MNLREKLNDLLHRYHKTEADIETIYYFPISTNQILQLNIIKTLELLENLEPDNTDLIKLQFKGTDFIIDCIDIVDENDEYNHSINFKFYPFTYNTNNVIYTPDSLTNTVYDEDFRLHVPFKTDTYIKRQKEKEKQQKQAQEKANQRAKEEQINYYNNKLTSLKNSQLKKPELFEIYPSTKEERKASKLSNKRFIHVPLSFVTKTDANDKPHHEFKDVLGLYFYEKIDFAGCAIPNDYDTAFKPFRLQPDKDFDKLWKYPTSHYYKSLYKDKLVFPVFVINETDPVFLFDIRDKLQEYYDQMKPYFEMEEKQLEEKLNKQKDKPMTSLINTIFEHLNFPKPIFDEKVTKTNLIPVVEELKNNDDDLENILYEITNADYFNDMTWILYSTNLDKKYPKTLHFLETIIENIKKEYVFGELSDLYESLQTKLMKTFLSSPGHTHYDKYTRFTYYLKHHEDADQIEVIILNGTIYTEFIVEDTDLYVIRDIYDILNTIDDACNAEPLTVDTMTEDAQSYYQALRDHIEDGSPINDIELEFLKRELKKGN